MEAENVGKIVKNLHNFGGIYDVCQLENVKILSLPVSIIVHDDGHWLGIFINNTSIEIMDSVGYISQAKSHQIYNFLGIHMKNKKFLVSPILQKSSASSCALYVICFLYYRTISHQSLCHFVNIFTTDMDLNCLIIYRIYNLIIGK